MAASDINFSELVDVSFNNTTDTLLDFTTATAAEGNALGVILAVIFFGIIFIFIVVLVLVGLKKLFKG